jgi:hypothetical protein
VVQVTVQLRFITFIGWNGRRMTKLCVNYVANQLYIFLTASCSRRQNIEPDPHPTTTARLAGQVAHDGHADGLQEVLQVPAALPGVQTARDDTLLHTPRHITVESRSATCNRVQLLRLWQNETPTLLTTTTASIS